MGKATALHTVTWVTSDKSNLSWGHIMQQLFASISPHIHAEMCFTVIAVAFAWCADSAAAFRISVIMQVHQHKAGGHLADCSNSATWDTLRAVERHLGSRRWMCLGNLTWDCPTAQPRIRIPISSVICLKDKYALLALIFILKRSTLHYKF